MRRQVGPRHLSCPRPHHSSRPPPRSLPPSPHVSSGTLARRTGVAASSPLNFTSGSGADAERPEAAGGGVRCRLGAEQDGAGVRDRNNDISDLAMEREVHEFFSFSSEIEHVDIRLWAPVRFFGRFFGCCYRVFLLSSPSLPALWFWALIGGWQWWGSDGEDGLRHLQEPQGPRDCATAIGMASCINWFDT
jgi:hypothetical protein